MKESNNLLNGIMAEMPTLQPPQQFLDDFCLSIKKAQKCIYLQSMNFEAGKILDTLTPLLIAKAKEGIDVRLHIDWVSQRFIHGELPVLPTLNKKKQVYQKNLREATNNILKKLQSANVKIVFENNPMLPSILFPYLKRNHIKIYVVDDAVGWIGGVNLFDEAFENVDFMVKFSEKQIVAAFTKQFFKINENKSKKDYSIRFNNQYEMLVDTGIIGKSIIYDKATSLAANAQKSITFISQVLPDGELLKLFMEKSKQVEIRIITSYEHNRNFVNYPMRLSYLQFLMRIKKNPSIVLIHLPRRVHAKLLVVDNAHVLFGSHNLIYGSVLLGIEEIAMYSTDTQLVQQCTRFLSLSIKS